MRFKAALFDMDGTLVNSERVYAISLRLALDELGITISDELSMNLTYGYAWSTVYQNIIKRYPGAAIGEEELDNKLTKHFEDIKRQQPSAFIIDGSKEVLQKLSSDIPVAIVSGSPRQHLAKFVKVLNVEKNIQFYLGTEDYPDGKPAPTPYLYAAKKIGVDPKDCIVFEDSTVGIISAKKAGMYCVAIKIPGAFEQDTSQADEVVQNLEDWYQNK